MLKFNKYLIVSILIIVLPKILFTQTCHLTVAGFVTDIDTGLPISQANVVIKETQSTGISDSLGFFSINSVCSGDYHISISFVRYETEELFLEISKDTTLTVFLENHTHHLNEAAVVSEGSIATQESHSLSSELIKQNSDKNLATMLEGISGVSTIKNGSGISKPLIHGLFGNRISILNNGVAQSGQQWGIDHGPEIDPLVANKITVIKGVGALEYQGSSLGGVVLVEPKNIREEPHLHGETGVFLESNGRGGGLQLQLQKHSEFLTWRVTGTVKKSGDNHTPDYFLRNTGSQEANLALQLEKNWNKKWFSELYFSSFNTELGVLRGSHIGNLTDLESAFEQEVPFFTEENFSYSISAPSQKVNHQLLKFHTRYTISENQQIDFTVAGQHNRRREFDVRRSGRSDMPALSLNQVSGFIEAKYQSLFSEGWKLKTGVQLNRIDNTNLPETGILPLIPDYIKYDLGAFGMVTKTMDKTKIEFGGRYNFENRKVATISNTIPREIVRFDTDYHNMTAMVGVTQKLGEEWKLAYNLGFSARNPAINELYSSGLHQGVSGIEEGDNLLRKEVSVKNTLSIKGAIEHKLFIEGLFYHQNIDDFIFLNPQEEIRLTIRGAFPVFKYEQTDARLFGVDLAATYLIKERLSFTTKYSYLNGRDTANDDPLVFMAPNNLYNALSYELPKLGNFQNIEFQVNSRIVFEQKNILETQDFVAPPESYFLLGFSFTAEKQLTKMRLKFFARTENTLNQTYRNYLNRQRYFADDLGFNLVIGVNIQF